MIFLRELSLRESVFEVLETIEDWLLVPDDSSLGDWKPLPYLSRASLLRFLPETSLGELNDRQLDPTKGLPWLRCLHFSSFI